MAIIQGVSVRRSSSQLPVAAHLFGIIAIILMLVWLLHFRGGLDLNSDNRDLIFNVHPFLMFIGFIFISGEAIMVYRTVWAEKKVQKCIHLLLHLIAATLAIIGIYAVFKFHKESGIPDMYSLHSWLGMGTICLYGVQWLFGFLYFWYPRAPDVTRARAVPVHALAGAFIFFLAICTALTGLVERFFFSQLINGGHALIINFTGIFILLYGVSVCFSVLSW